MLAARHALLYTLRSSGARGLEALTYYRHIAPLERKIKRINFNDNPMDFQYLSTWRTYKEHNHANDTQME